ncbi:MAG TPA: ABC transporter permease subunit [Steroidobacteraceae bacterium]|jgi:putrescine transport system permease protein|nr:ABC transporter permease subunit [Steroidobacteraceae bacterium]
MPQNLQSVNQRARRLVMGVPTLWLLLLFLLPFLIVLKLSFSQERLTIPPYAPLLEWINGVPHPALHFSNYAFLFTDPLYISAYLYSLKVAAVSTLLCLLLGYPMAYVIARAQGTWRSALLMLIVLPFWTSFLLRVYAWIGLLKHNGVINNILLYLGIIHQPLTMLQTDFAVYVGIVYSYLPFMILPLYANLEKLDGALLEAAADLGARPFTAFLRVTLPQSIPGIIAGSLLVFIPAVGEYVVPSLLGRTDQLMIGRVLSDEFFENRDWPLASAVAILMLLLLVVPIMLFQRSGGRQIQSHP